MIAGTTAQIFASVCSVYRLQGLEISSRWLPTESANDEPITIGFASASTREEPFDATGDDS